MPDSFIKQQILKGYLEFCPLPPHSDDEIKTICNGKFSLGTILPQACSLTIDPVTLLKYNGLCCGASGQGKTHLLTLLASSLLEYKNIGSFVFDVRPEITQQLPLKHVSVSNIIPALLEYKEYFKNPKAQAVQIADIILDPFLLQYSKTAVSRELLKYYEQGKSPSLKQLRDDIAKLKPSASGLTNQQLLKLRSVLDLLILQLGRASEETCGFRIEDYQNEKLLITLDLDNTVNALLITYYLWSIYTHNIAKNLREQLRCVFFIDESRFFINPQRDLMVSDFGEPYLSTIFSQQRSAGLSVIAFSQVGHTKLFSSNAGLKVIFNMGDARYFHAAISAMGLSRQEEDYLKRTLTPGTAIMQMYYHPKPFICKLKKAAADYYQETRIENKEKFSFHIENKPAQIKTTHKEPSRQKNFEQQVLAVGLVPEAILLLKCIAKNPFTPLTDAYKALGLSRTKGNIAKEHLQTHDLVISTQVRMFQGRGRQPLLLSITKNGLEYLKAHEPTAKISHARGRGSLQHQVYQALIAKHYRDKGWLARIEHQNTDVAAEDPSTGKIIYVEVATKYSQNLRQRIENNRAAGCCQTIIVADRKIYERFTRQYSGKSGVEVRCSEDFLLRRGERL